MLTATSGFAQMIKIDSISITKPGAQEEITDPSMFKDLEPFRDKDDAIVYIYRLSSMVGAAAKWEVSVDTLFTAKLKQKEYVVIHMDGTAKSHYFYFPDMRYNYTNIKPNKYYYVMLKGFSMKTGYMNETVLSDLKSCKLPEEKKK